MDTENRMRLRASEREALLRLCMMCSLDTIGQRKCKLRKALDVIPNDVEDVEKGCKFFSVV